MIKILHTPPLCQERDIRITKPDRIIRNLKHVFLVKFGAKPRITKLSAVSVVYGREGTVPIGFGLASILCGGRLLLALRPRVLELGLRRLTRS